MLPELSRQAVPGREGRASCGQPLWVWSCVRVLADGPPVSYTAGCGPTAGATDTVDARATVLAPCRTTLGKRCPVCEEGSVTHGTQA